MSDVRITTSEKIWIAETVDSKIAGEAAILEISTIAAGMGIMRHHLDTWRIVLSNRQGTVLVEVGEEITMTLVAEVVEDEVISTAVVAEVEEDAEGEGLAVAEDLMSLSEEEVEAEEEGLEDSMMIEEEEVETVADQTLVVEAEVGTDETRFEVWIPCHHHAMVNEIDHATCLHAEMDPGICLVTERSEMVAPVTNHEETNHF